jgi:hypothetical protein
MNRPVLYSYIYTCLHLCVHIKLQTKCNHSQTYSLFIDLLLPHIFFIYCIDLLYIL